MSPAVASLLRRLASLVAGTSAATASDATIFSTPLSSSNEHDQFRVTRTEQPRTSKLVYGKAIHGASVLASHGSHRSHASHSSHASHYSGTSGSTDSSYRATPAPPPVVTPKPASSVQKPEVQKPAPIPQKVDSVLSNVLQKLPKIRSRWPAEAVLSKTTQFNLFDGDRIIGIVTLNPGAKVKVVEIKQEHAVARFGDKESSLPVSNTDIIDRMGGVEKILAYPDDDPLKVEKTADKESPKK